MDGLWCVGVTAMLTFDPSFSHAQSSSSPEITVNNIEIINDKRHRDK